jgi:PrtD family type I secretion system ABC transporter
MLGILAVVSAIILFVLAMLNDFRTRKPAQEAKKASFMAHRVYSAGMHNSEAIAAMGMLPRIKHLWTSLHDSALLAQVKGRDRAGTLSASSKSLRLFVQSAMLAAGAVLVVKGELTAGSMIAASIILGRALQPIEQSVVHWRNYIQYREARKQLAQLLKTMPPQARYTQLPKPQGNIDVRELHIAPPGSKELALRNINFSLPAGKILGIIGDSGSGKSSLVRVLANIWRPNGGEVRIDGATLDQWQPHKLGLHIGYVPQDVELLEGSIAENISRFEENPEAEKIIRAARQANAHDMITAIGGYDRQVGPDGKQLSGGQKQRIALARALYGEPTLIILDEPYSNLDQDGEKAIYSALAEMRKRGQTVIIVAHMHRTRLLDHADSLLVLQNAKQILFGPRNEVLSKLGKRSSSGPKGQIVHRSGANQRFHIIMGGSNTQHEGND